jgi:hypothetical protein
VHVERADAAAMQRVEAGLAARHRQQPHRAGELLVQRGVVEHVGGGVVAELAQEPVLRAEGQRAAAGVDPVGADQQVGLLAGAVVQLDDDLAGRLVVGERGDAAAKKVTLHETA